MIRCCDNLSWCSKPAEIAVVTSCCARESQYGRCVNIISAVIVFYCMIMAPTKKIKISSRFPGFNLGKKHLRGNNVVNEDNTNCLNGQGNIAKE